ncbi:MAG: PEGA domain-containing protein [Myxococcota bacterium]
MRWIYAALLSLLTSVAVAAPRAKKVVVSDLSGLGLDNRVIGAFARYLETSLKTIEGVTLISSIDVEFALQDPRNRDLADCGGGTRARTVCAAKIGALVGANIVIYGTIGAIGESYSVNLRAVEVSSGRQLVKHTATIAGSRDRLIPEVRLAAFKLVAPDRIFGSLKIDTDVEGVLVEIDGKEVGTTPLADPIANLTPGSHVVVLRRPGFKEFQQEFRIKAFETAKLKLELRSLQGR